MRPLGLTVCFSLSFCGGCVIRVRIFLGELLFRGIRVSSGHDQSMATAVQTVNGKLPFFQRQLDVAFYFIFKGDISEKIFAIFR